QNLFAINARRPFATPEWDDPSPKSSSSANIPIEISPAAAFDRPSTAMMLANRSELPAATDVTPSPTVPEPFDAPADPFADVADVEAPEIVAPEDDAPLLIAAAPMLAPGSVVASQPIATKASQLDAGPALTVAPAPPVETSSAATEVAAVEPVELEEANAAAAREAAMSDRSTFSAPAVIGIALAIVAFGAVVIRRRFA
ncbi:MAG: hypothetical protein M3552_22555, partial [Planctomycetota bacterium]|nr:hypothetical protein [Planctomycetota bacterium]